MMWRLWNRLFRWEYVLLMDFEGYTKIRRAYRLHDSMWAHPYLPETRVELLPGGRVRGRCYIRGWRPLTPGIQELWRFKPKHEPGVLA